MVDILKRRINAARYRASIKGKATLARWQASVEGRASKTRSRTSVNTRTTSKQYRASAQGRAALKRFKASAKGRAGAARYRQQYKTFINEKRLLKMYGLPLGGYNLFLSNQHGRCALCLQPASNIQRLDVDHDHYTGKIRGLLCRNCNMALGKLAGSVVRVTRLVDYLQCQNAFDGDGQASRSSARIKPA